MVQTSSMRLAACRVRTGRASVSYGTGQGVVFHRRLRDRLSIQLRVLAAILVPTNGGAHLEFGMFLGTGGQVPLVLMCSSRSPKSTVRVWVDQNGELAAL